MSPGSTSTSPSSSRSSSGKRGQADDDGVAGAALHVLLDEVDAQGRRAVLLQLLGDRARRRGRRPRPRGRCRSSASASRTCSTIGRPHSRCSGFGRVDRIRVPSPAASTMADSVMPLFYQRERDGQASYGESSCVCRPIGSLASMNGFASTAQQARCRSTPRSTRCTRTSPARRLRTPADRSTRAVAPPHSSMTCATASGRCSAPNGSQVIFGPSATALVFALHAGARADVDGIGTHRLHPARPRLERHAVGARRARRRCARVR